jgi:hydroxyacylglutathione hydrolase
MIIQDFPSGPFETNAYVVSCPITKETAIFDPAPNSSESLIAYVTENHLTVQMILITHSHWDHIADVSKIKDHYYIPVYVHTLDALNLTKPGSDGLPYWISLVGVKPDKLLTDGELINLGSLQFKVIHTPGHSPGGVCFFCESEEVLFSGDTLFRSSIGKLSFPTSEPDKMWESLSKLARLPGTTKVYPGHGPSTMIGNEKWLANAKQIFG